MQNYQTITITANDFPEELTRLHQVPTKLYLKGNQSLLDRKPRVGIIGARKFTPYGRAVTDEISGKLASRGVTIVSGLALGIDGIAHQSALKSGGATIAVLPCGIDRFYPATHRNLGMQILQQNSLIISEYTGSYLPNKYNFIERNRLIAALSDVLVITEAALSSGSLHTAGFALDLGIPIMAVPGNITSPTSAGANQLIQNGALALLSVSDVLNVLGLDDSEKLDYLPENETEKLIIDAIKANNNRPDDIANSTKIPTNELQTTLTILEIKGVLDCQSGKWHVK